ncbi:hypothetical protein C8J56DRAFT_1037436 [Mycena floridula]|nr:hypothetical protein C8J56DRAFT_1037436 [Mycena floridula]
MSAMDIIEAAVDNRSTSQPNASGMNSTSRMETIQYWKDKCIDLLEKRELLQARLDDSQHDYCSLKEKYRDCCRELNIAEGEAKELKTEINGLNEKINTLSNCLESRGRSISPKRRRTESSTFNDAANVKSPNTDSTPQVMKGMPKHSSTMNAADMKKDFKSFLSEHPLPKTLAEFKRELTNSKMNSFTGKCATYILSALLSEAVHTPSQNHTLAMKSIIEMGWTTPTGFSLQFKKSKSAKPPSHAVEMLPALRYDPSKVALSDSYLPLMPDIQSIFADSTEPITVPSNATLSDNEIRQQINDSPCPKYLTLQMNNRQTGEYLLYHADLKHQYPGVNITVNGDVYSIDLRQLPVPGKYAQLLRDLHLTPIDTNVPVCFKEFPTPPDGVAITKSTLAKHLHSCNITALFMNDIFPYGRRFTELQVGKAQPIEESGAVNHVREVKWNETLTESNNAITFGHPAVALRPSHKKKSKSTVIHAVPKTLNPQVKRAAEQLGVISFTGLPSFIDKANESIGSVSPFVESSAGNPDTVVTSIDINADMVSIDDVIDTRALCGSENEDDFADVEAEIVDNGDDDNGEMSIDETDT